MECPALAEVFLNGLVHKPRRVFSDKIYPEVCSILTQLAAVDEPEYIRKLHDLGLPAAIL